MHTQPATSRPISKEVAAALERIRARTRAPSEITAQEKAAQRAARIQARKGQVEPDKETLRRTILRAGSYAAAARVMGWDRAKVVALAKRYGLPAYSINIQSATADDRRKIMQAIKSAGGDVEAAELLGLSIGWVQRVRRDWIAAGGGEV